MVQAAYGFIKNSTSLWVLSKHVHLTQHSYFKYMYSGSIMVSKHVKPFMQELSIPVPWGNNSVFSLTDWIIKVGSGDEQIGWIL